MTKLGVWKSWKLKVPLKKKLNKWRRKTTLEFEVLDGMGWWSLFKAIRAMPFWRVFLLGVLPLTVQSRTLWFWYFGFGDESRRLTVCASPQKGRMRHCCQQRPGFLKICSRSTKLSPILKIVPNLEFFWPASKIVPNLKNKVCQSRYIFQYESDIYKHKQMSYFLIILLQFHDRFCLYKMYGPRFVNF